MGRSLATLLSICTAATLVPSTAQAFCGTYVGGAGAELYNPKVIIHPIGTVYSSAEDRTRIVFNKK